ncbi:protransforming growth factor alpha-like isoform X2 [Hyperolius riggenbachi]|uniref:protransforming growth factor alpha-like isoform X2 n=1 Tax=Hyperolius riggenbachi TaxID=752182 RepID=UPI0035A338B0
MMSRPRPFCVRLILTLPPAAPRHHRRTRSAMFQLLFLIAASYSAKASPQTSLVDCPDSHSDFCFHGTCRFLVSESAPSCKCFKGYDGSRCEYVNLMLLMATDPRSFLAVALSVTFVVILTLIGSTCLGIYFCRIRSTKIGVTRLKNTDINDAQI